MFCASIVAYNTPISELEQVFRPLRDAGVDRIDVVDNSASSEIEDWCRVRGVNYVPHANNGYGAGHNVSLRRSIAEGADYHLVLNSDMQFTGVDLLKMIEHMDAHKDVALLHPRVLGLDGKDQYTVRMLPTPLDLLLRRFAPSWLFAKRRARYLLQHLDHNQEFDAAYVQGSFMLLRVESLKRTGLFDERFFMYPEDIDLSRRLAERERVVYYPAVKVVHAHRAASYRSLKMLWVHLSNMAKYFNKWGWFFDPGRREMNKRVYNP